MSQLAGFDQDHDPVPSFARAHAQSPEPAMDHDHDDPPDRDEPAPGGPPGDAVPPPGRPNFWGMILALASRIPLPSLGTERHEMVLAAPPPPTSTEDVAPTGPERVPSPLKQLIMKREARVGAAALLSIVLLVAAFGVKNGWTGKLITLAMNHKGDADPTLPEPGREPEPKADGKEGEATKGRDDKHHEEGEPTPTPAPVGGAKKPDPNPIISSDHETKLGGNATVGEPSSLPLPSAEASKPAVLGGGSPTNTPPSAPEAPLPKPPDSPPGPIDPIPLSPDSMPILPTPTLAADPDPPATVPDAKPEETKPKPVQVTPPAQANDLPPLGDSSAMTPPGEATQAPPAVPEPAPLLIPEPTPPPVASAASERFPTPAPAQRPVASAAPERPPTPAPTPRPVASAGPVPTENPLTFEPIPAVEPSATKASTAGALGGNWVVIPSGGRRLVGPMPIISTPVDAQGDPSRIADGPRFADDLAAADQVEPVVHVVRPGENFWTISNTYYHEGRFYRALHAANRKQVPDIAGLWVGTVLRIPPLEALDRALIDPPSRQGADDAATSTISRTSNSKRADPADEADLAMPARPRPRPVRLDPEAVEPPRRPTYKVKPRETLRGIARDTLNDSKRDREIYNLNRDVLDDINDPLPAGTILTLPADATVGRRAAR